MRASGPIVVGIVAIGHLLLTFTFEVISLKTILRVAILLLQYRHPLIRTALLLVHVLTVLRHALLLLLDELALALL